MDRSQKQWGVHVMSNASLGGAILYQTIYTQVTPRYHSLNIQHILYRLRNTSIVTNRSCEGLSVIAKLSFHPEAY